MTKLKTTTQLMGILLASMLVISCGANKRSKEAEETEKLVSEQKKLVEDFKQKHKLTPEQAKKFEEYIEEHKKNNSLENIKLEISSSEQIKADLESGDPLKVKIMSDTFKAFFEAFMPGFVIKDEDHCKQVITDYIAILENIKKQVELKDKNSKDKKAKDKS